MDVVPGPAHEDVMIDAILHAHSSEHCRVCDGGFEFRDQEVERFAGGVVHAQSAAGRATQAAHKDLRAVDLHKVELRPASDAVDSRMKRGELRGARRNVTQKLEIL